LAHGAGCSREQPQAIPIAPQAKLPAEDAILEFSGKGHSGEVIREDHIAVRLRSEEKFPFAVPACGR